MNLMIMNCSNLVSKEYTECCDNRKICSAIENKRKYELLNASLKKVCKIKIDGGYIIDSTVKKCDYGFFICSDNHILLVELKGKDLIHAIGQILSTITLKRNEFENLKVSVRIVLTKMNVPNIQNNPKFLKLKKIITQRKGDIKYKSKILSENYT